MFLHFFGHGKVQKHEMPQSRVLFRGPFGPGGAMCGNFYGRPIESLMNNSTAPLKMTKISGRWECTIGRLMFLASLLNVNYIENVRSGVWRVSFQILKIWNILDLDMLKQKRRLANATRLEIHRKTNWIFFSPVISRSLKHWFFLSRETTNLRILHIFLLRGG